MNWFTQFVRSNKLGRWGLAAVALLALAAIFAPFLASRGRTYSRSGSRGEPWQ